VAIESIGTDLEPCQDAPHPTRKSAAFPTQAGRADAPSLGVHVVIPMRKSAGDQVFGEAPPYAAEGPGTTLCGWPAASVEELSHLANEFFI
jgi:hypothetical protein